MTKLSVRDLRVRYGENEILKKISLDLQEGEILVLLGPSGSGKTTLLRSIAGLERPSSGSILIDGRPVYDETGHVEIPAEKRNLGLVFQSYALWPHRTVSDNIAYGLKLRGVSESERAERTAAALSQLGLGDLGSRFPHQLSGGQQQRVAVARALVYNPPVILLDEPLSNLDAKLRDEAKAWLRGLIRERRLSAVLVTHDQSEALAMADRIALLSDGVLEQEGSPQDIYLDPRSLVTAEFFGSNNRLEGRIEDVRGRHACVSGDGWKIWGLARGAMTKGAKATAVIRVERVRFGNGLASDNVLNLDLLTTMFAGDRWQHAFKVSDFIVRAYGDSEIATGRHTLSVSPDAVWIFG